jgi:hypothetical protein
MRREKEIGDQEKSEYRSVSEEKVNFLSRPQKVELVGTAAISHIGFLNTRSGYLFHRAMWLG